MMKITVNVNIENNKRGWAAVANHVKHDPHQKHSNKDIEPELRSLDAWGLGAKYGVRKWQEEKFGAFVKAHDEKLKKQGRREKNRYYHSVQGFLGRKNRQTAVVTFGNNESWKEIIRNHCKENVDYTIEHEDKGNGNVYEWYKLNPKSKTAKLQCNVIASTFKDWRDSLNADPVISKYMQIGRCAVHFDEHGAPHMHAEMAFCGRTKKGAPTPSMSTAIMQMVAEKTGITPKNNREAFREFRKITDERLIKVSANHTWVKGTDHEPWYELARTGRDTSRDMETYKATEDQRLADEKKLEQIKAQRKAEEQRLAELQQQRQSLEERETRMKKLEQENEKLKRENHGLKAFKAKVEQFEEKLGVKDLDELFDKIQALADDVVYYVRSSLKQGVMFFATKGRKLPHPKRWKQAFEDFNARTAYAHPENFFMDKRHDMMTNYGRTMGELSDAICGRRFLPDKKCLEVVHKQIQEEQQSQYQEPKSEEHDFGGPSL